MELTQNIHATRAHGTLSVELEDGRTAELEVDLDLSDPASSWGVQYDYAESDLWGRTPLPARGATWSIYLPPTSGARLEREGYFVLRIPVIE